MNIVREYRETKAAATWALNQARSKYVQLKYANPPVFIRVISARRDQPWFDSATSYEIDYPYRQGAAIIIRAGGRALLIGILDNHPDLDDTAIDQRLLAAIRATDGGESYWDTPEARDEWARQAVAKHATDPDDEGELYEQLGLW